MERKYIHLELDTGPVEIWSNSHIGNNNLLFFIHGLGCSAETFDLIWKYNDLLQYSILIFDLLGFGKSSKPEHFPYSLESHADICRRLLQLYAGYRIHIIGHSMGGAIGLLLSMMIQKRQGSFINVEGNLIGSDTTISRKGAEKTYEEFINYDLPKMILTTSHSDEPGERLWSRLIQESSHRALYRSSRSLVKWSDSGKLLTVFKEMRCPRVYIYGERNSFMLALSHLQDIERIAVPHSGHFPMNDNPDIFYSILTEMLKTITENGNSTITHQ